MHITRESFAQMFAELRSGPDLSDYAGLSRKLIRGLPPERAVAVGRYIERVLNVDPAEDEYDQLAGCKKTMRFIGQVENAVAWGHEGMTYGFLCKRCKITATGYQQS